MLRCMELGFTISDLEQVDYGLVADMIIERGNDEYDYPVKATEEDFKKFRGR